MGEGDHRTLSNVLSPSLKVFGSLSGTLENDSIVSRSETPPSPVGWERAGVREKDSSKTHPLGSPQTTPLRPLTPVWAHLDTVLKVSGKRFLTGQNNQRNQCQQMEPKKKLLPSLGDIEREVVAESREWGRQRLQQRLQQLADQNSEVFPPPATKTSKTHAAKRVGRRKTGR